MIRRALLIAVPDTPGEHRLPGTAHDVRMLSSHLRSIAGGAWEDSEILVLTNPSRPQVERSMQFVFGAEYSFVSFSGHGFEAPIPGMPGFAETQMICSDRYSVGRGELTPGSRKSTILLDCCRNFIDSRVDGVGDIKMGRSEFGRVSRIEAREIFDAAVRRAQVGPAYVYGCEFDGTAADDPSFTASLVNVAGRWATEHAGFLNLADCFDQAKTLHRRVQPGRTPQLEIGRAYADQTVPFAVGSVRATRYG